ncbi:MAG: hypothetical protein PXY39_07270 [archaeon]|nr:hypothetical protein [archaeon]
MSTTDTNPDVRAQIEANRGIAKNLELLIPGLHGYRALEDVRAADSIVRNQVSDKLDQCKSNLEDLRSQMVANNDFTNLTNVGSLIAQVQQISGEVRHSQQGYSGFAANIKIDQGKLNKLYEYDYDFVSSALALQGKTSIAYDPMAPNSVQTTLSDISNALRTLKQAWSVRMEAVESVLLK